MTPHSRRLIAPVLAASAVLPARTFSETLPPDASRRLTQILEQNEFQPRREPQGFFANLWETYGTDFIEWVKSSFHWVHQRIPKVDPPDWLRSMGETIQTWIAYLVDGFEALFSPAVIVPIIVVALALLTWRHRHQLAFLLGRFDAVKPSPALSAVRPLRLDDLAAATTAKELLEGMRLLLRRSFHETHSIPAGVSDRELLRSIPGDDHRHEVFSDISLLFEQWAFAFHQPSDEAAQALYGRLCSVIRGN